MWAPPLCSQCGQGLSLPHSMKPILTPGPGAAGHPGCAAGLCSLRGESCAHHGASFSGHRAVTTGKRQLRCYLVRTLHSLGTPGEAPHLSHPVASPLPRPQLPEGAATTLEVSVEQDSGSGPAQASGTESQTSPTSPESSAPKAPGGACARRHRAETLAAVALLPHSTLWGFYCFFFVFEPHLEVVRAHSWF